MALRLVLLGIACVVAAAASFWATLIVIDRRPNSAVASRAGANDIVMKAGVLSASSGARLDATADGLALTSLFDPAKTGSVDGAAYLNFPAGKIAAVPGKTLRIEIDASAPQSAGPTQIMEVLYVQNGLQSSPWVKFPLSEGRKTYDFKFKAPAETRGADRIDTLWLRGDATGTGGTVTLHTIRLLVE